MNWSATDRIRQGRKTVDVAFANIVGLDDCPGCKTAAETVGGRCVVACFGHSEDCPLRPYELLMLSIIDLELALERSNQVTAA